MPKLLSLQMARGVAANIVVVGHLFDADAIFRGANMPEFALVYGSSGVDVFFVLSGFIMVGVAGRQVGPQAFLWRRVTRIYPIYWLATFATLALAMVSPTLGAALEQGSLWRSLLLIPAETPLFVSVGWTLVHEMYFYLVFAGFLAMRIPITLGLVGWGLSIVAMTIAAPDQIAASPILQVITHPLTAEFMMGALVGLLWLNSRMPGARFAAIVGLAVVPIEMLVGYLSPEHALIYDPQFSGLRVLLFGIPAALIIYGLAGAEQRVPGPRTPLFMAALGDWSYSTYLMHPLVIGPFGHMLVVLDRAGGVARSITLIVGGLILSNIAGAIAHLCFKRPTLRWLHQIGPSGPAALRA
jgi:peptidoglycan/LPS O-acetylase OafA/YrhL